MMLIDKNLYYVGGVVRDKLLNLSSLDVDFCYEGNAIEYAKSLGLKIIKQNDKLGTVRVYLNNSEIDIASTRVEHYPKKGHLPHIKQIGCSLKEDLIRRDFTINAMAMRTTDMELIDYCGGKDDIKSKKLRVLHSNSFTDDPTRIIRGLKFSVRFGFHLSGETMSLQERYLENINYDMSYSRIRKELVDTFSLNSEDAYDKFISQGIYKLLGKNLILPDIKGADIKSKMNEYNCNNWFLYLAPIFCINNCEHFPLTRPENRILNWCKRLKSQAPVNNTPKESILLFDLLR